MPKKTTKKKTLSAQQRLNKRFEKEKDKHLKDKSAEFKAGFYSALLFLVSYIIEASFWGDQNAKNNAP